MAKQKLGSPELYVGTGTLLQGLSRKRQEAIRPVLEHPKDYVLLSVRDLAKNLHCDPATALRIIQSMGFSTYRQFQRYLHELSMVRATTLDQIQSISWRDSNIHSHIRETLDRNLRNLQGLRHSLDFEKVEKVAKRLYSSRRIILLGGDLATSLVSFLQYNLLVLGLPVLAVTTTGHAVHLLSTVGKGDMIVAISFRRGLRHTVEGLQRGRSRGAYCVGITDSLLSPITRFAHECFIASVETTFGVSYVAPMALLDVLLDTCAILHRKRTIARLKEAAKDERTGFRWYREA